MKYECSVVGDLLPLYAENLVSQETAAFVTEHLAACPACSQKFKSIKTPPLPPQQLPLAPMKQLKKKLSRQRFQASLITALFVLAIAVAAFAAMGTPQYFPYSEDLVTVRTNADDTVILTFREDVTGCSYTVTKEADGQARIYHVEAWKSLWDNLFTPNKLQTLTIPADSPYYLVYYVQNGTGEDIPLASNLARVSSGGCISLPHLALGYYLFLAAGVFIILLVLRLILCKNNLARLWLERGLLLPLSYAAGHLIVKGFDTVTYSLVYDFTIILLLTLLIYAAALLGHNIYRMKKDIESTP